jgi:hypothetical protein
VSVPGSTRRQNSANDANGPSFDRASRIAWTTPSPTLRTADRPYRIAVRSPGAGAKSAIDSFTSGGSTSMPIPRHAYR